MEEYFYSDAKINTEKSLFYRLKTLLKGEMPVVVCIGTDAIIGDSLGPLVGTMLEERIKDLFVYGSLQRTITAKEVNTVAKYLERVHKNDKILVIDAAVGNDDDVGKIKISNAPIKPGLGADKDLEALGDISIVSVVSAKEKDRCKVFSSLTRLSDIFNTAKIISNAITMYIRSIKEEKIIVNY